MKAQPRMPSCGKWEKKSSWRGPERETPAIFTLTSYYWCLKHHRGENPGYFSHHTWTISQRRAVGTEKGDHIAEQRSRAAVRDGDLHDHGQEPIRSAACRSPTHRGCIQGARGPACWAWRNKGREGTGPISTSKGRRQRKKLHDFNCRAVFPPGEGLNRRWIVFKLKISSFLTAGHWPATPAWLAGRGRPTCRDSNADRGHRVTRGQKSQGLCPLQFVEYRWLKRSCTGHAAFSSQVEE